MVWVDAVQWEEGGPRPYQPAAPVETAVRAPSQLPDGRPTCRHRVPDFSFALTPVRGGDLPARGPGWPPGSGAHGPVRSETDPAGRRLEGLSLGPADRPAQLGSSRVRRFIGLSAPRPAPRSAAPDKRSSAVSPSLLPGNLPLAWGFTRGAIPALPTVRSRRRPIWARATCGCTTFAASSSG